MKTITLLLTFLISLPTFAQYESYDEIVDKLSKYNDKELTDNQAYRGEIRTYSRVHAGLGVAQTFYDADAVGFDSRMQNQGGLIINLGVDVLNPQWGLEGSYANYGTSNSNETDIKLREFTLKGLYKPSINKTWTMRLGMGFSSRFLDVNNSQTSETYRTPSGLFLFGVDSYISSLISVGADLSFKTAMIDDTIDKNSVDLSFRIDTHF